MLPQIVILYGPPNAGKGTQSSFLKEKLPNYYHLDFGTELRKFVKQAIGDYSLEEEQIQTHDKEILDVARRLKDDMKNSLPVKSDDLRFVIETTINNCVEKGTGMIIEGPGRLIEEAQWLSAFLGQKKASVCIFHLYLSLEEVLERSRHRYYVTSTKISYPSFETALKDCVGDEKPYRRQEDLDEEGTKQRYRLLYSDNSAKILSIYQLNAGCLVFTLDASKVVHNVSEDIIKYFQLFYSETI